jgi:CRISPR/Cas system-associated endoribonuclease Cas2
MSDTDGSLYGGDSAEDLVGSNNDNCQLVVTSLSPKPNVFHQLAIKGAPEESVFSALCTSTPVRGCFLPVKRSLSFSDLNMDDSDEEDNCGVLNNKGERHRAGLSADVAPRRFVDRRLEMTMPELGCQKFEDTFEVRRMRDAWSRIQVTLVINAYRKARAAAAELESKLKELQTMHEEAVGKLKITKLDAVSERAKAEEVRRDLATALNQLDHQQMVSEGLQKEVHKLGLKSRNMEALCIKLEESVKVRDATLNDLQAELGNQKENLRKAYVALAEKEENVRSLGNKIEGLEKKTQELAFCVTKAEELNNGYVEQLRQKSQELGKAQQNICELIDAKAELEDYLNSVQQEVFVLKEDMANQMMNEDLLNKTIDGMNDSLTIYEADQAALRDNLTVAKTENFNLKKAILEKHLAARLDMLKPQPHQENLASMLLCGFLKGVASTFMPFQTSFVRYL